MKRVVKILLVLITLSSLFVSCKKYPDDNVRYWFNEKETPEKRIVGTWRITKYFINGADSTSMLFNSFIGYGIYGNINSPPPLYQYGIFDMVISTPDPNNVYDLNVSSIGAGGWLKFENKKNSLFIVFAALYYNILPFNPFRENPNLVSIPYWKIEELTNLNFKITNTINNISYRIEFIKQ